MTYGELSKIKTVGFNTNHVIDDAVNNCRWSMTRAEVRRGEMDHEIVSDYVLGQSLAMAEKEGVAFPPSAVAVPSRFSDPAYQRQERRQVRVERSIRTQID